MFRTVLPPASSLLILCVWCRSLAHSQKQQKPIARAQAGAACECNQRKRESSRAVTVADTEAARTSTSTADSSLAGSLPRTSTCARTHLCARHAQCMHALANIIFACANVGEPVQR
eukprot:5889286-Pleurochrysis_carterae.AAC.4